MKDNNRLSQAKDERHHCRRTRDERPAQPAF